MLSVSIQALTKDEKWMIEDLESKNEESILQAAEFFANRDQIPDEALPLLVSALSQYDYNIRTAVQKALLKNPKKSLPFVIEGLKNESEMIREWSAKTIEAMGSDGKPAANALLQLAFDTEWNVKNAALSALQKLGKEPAVMAAKLLEKEEDEDRKIFYLQIISSHPDAVDYKSLYPSLESDNFDLIEKSLNILTASLEQNLLPRDAHDKILEISVPLLQNERKTIRHQAASLFSIIEDSPNLQKKYIPALLKHLREKKDSSDDPFAFPSDGSTSKEGFIYALGYIGPPALSASDTIFSMIHEDSLHDSSVFALSKILSKNPEKLNPWITSHKPEKATIAAQIIEKMNKPDKKLIPKLIECSNFYSKRIQKDNNKEAFETCIRTLGTAGKNSWSALQTIGKHLKSQNESIILASIIALSKTGESGSIYTDQLAGYLFHENRDIRKWAAICLGNIGPKASSAIYELKKALKDKDTLVKAEAGRALIKIQIR